MGIPGAIDDIRPFAELAQSATTVVYKAYQSSLERFVLLKRLRGEYGSDEDLSARFQEEARIAARVQHRNIVSVYAYGSDDAGAYIVAEFVEGIDLRELIDRGRIHPDVAVYILLESAKGLKAAHDKDVVHRDLKPSNILISHEGEVKLTDFGLASVSGAADGDPEEIRGTLSYLAPEQILGDPIDHRCDLFSLGATFFEMLTGRRAFPGSNSKEILDAVLNRDADTFLRATPGVTSEIEAVGSTLLARNPNDRFADVGVLIETLEAYRHGALTKIGRGDLKEYLEDPESLALPVAGSLERAFDEPNVTVVPNRAVQASTLERVLTNGEGDSLFGSERVTRLARGTAVAAALLFFAAAVVFAGVELLGGSGAATRGTIAGDFRGDRYENDSLLSTAFGLLPLDSLQLGSDSAAAAEESARPPFAAARQSPHNSDTDDGREMGVLAIRVDPWAGVLVEGDSLGTARSAQPLFAELSPGQHEITLSNPDFPRMPREFRVRAGDTTSVTVSLWSLVGRLDLHVSPWANVYVDGRHVGQTPLGAPLILLPGVRQLRLENPELGIERTYSVTVSRGDVLKREYILTDVR